MILTKEIIVAGYQNEILTGCVTVADKQILKEVENRIHHETERKQVTVYEIKGFVKGAQKFSDIVEQEGHVFKTVAIAEDKVKAELQKLAHPNAEGKWINQLRELGYK